MLGCTDRIGSEQARITCHLGAADGIATHFHVSVVYRRAQCKLDAGSAVFVCFRLHIVQQTKDKNSFIVAVTESCRTAVWCTSGRSTQASCCALQVRIPDDAHPLSSLKFLVTSIISRSIC